MRVKHSEAPSKERWPHARSSFPGSASERTAREALPRVARLDVARHYCRRRSHGQSIAARQSLAPSAFPGRAWERESVGTRHVRASPRTSAVAFDAVLGAAVGHVLAEAPHDPFQLVRIERLDQVMVE